MSLDPRYDLIKLKLAKGYIKSFNDIFLFIPKTVVANDLGKKVDRFNHLMAQVGKFTLHDFDEIATRCNLSLSDMLKLARIEFERQKKQHRKAG